jgi:hypothetical protein
MGTFAPVFRWGKSQSKFFRYIALHMDDYFYGKRPMPKPMPKELI